jgi:hypothetical protein
LAQASSIGLSLPDLLRFEFYDQIYHAIVEGGGFAMFREAPSVSSS